MSRPIYVYWKRGDNGHYKHGMEVGVYDPIEWGHDEIQEMMHFSPWMQTVYQITIHSREEKAEYLEGLEEIGPKDIYGEFIRGHVDHRVSKKMLDIDKLKNVSKDVDIDVKLKSGKHQDKIDCRANKKIAKDTSSATFFPHIPDLRVITSGNYSHGTAGDYSDIIALLADINSGSVDGTFNFTQISDESLSSAITMNQDYGAFDANFLSSAPHGGDITAGWTISSSSGTNLLTCQAQTGATGIIDFGGISIVRSGGASALANIFLDGRRAGTEVRFHDLFVDGAGVAATGIIFRSIGGGAGAKVKMYNNSIRDCTGNGLSYLSANIPLVDIQQVLVEGCNVGFESASLAATVINSGFVNNTTDVQNIGGSTGDFNITGDASGANGNWNTGTNNITGVTPGAEWELDDTSSEYAAVLGSNASSSTTTPTIDASLMDGAWTNEIGPKIKLGGGVPSRSYPRGFLRGYLRGVA